MELRDHLQEIEGIDHTNTLVLIIGISEFPEDKTISPIPNVLMNVSLLRSSLVNPDLIGIPEQNIFVSINENRKQIERKLLSIADMASKNTRFTLIIYYSGHGILSSNDFKLYLTTHDTNKNYLETDAIHIDTFKRYIKKSHATRKIVILDCCHSCIRLGTDSPGTFLSRHSSSTGDRFCLVHVTTTFTTLMCGSPFGL